MKDIANLKYPFSLPALGYGFDALEPHIDARTMEIHHGKHHAAYVAGLAAALQKAPDLAARPLQDLLASLSAVADESVRTPLRSSSRSFGVSLT